MSAPRLSVAVLRCWSTACLVAAGTLIVAATSACTVVVEPDPTGSGGAGGNGSGGAGGGLPPVILIVQDRSGSMDTCLGSEPARDASEACGADADSNGFPDSRFRSRMDVAQTVVSGAVAQHAADVAWGLILYGVSSPNVACGEAELTVPVGEDPSALQDAYAADLRIDRPLGGTPTTSALRAAYDALVDPASDVLRLEGRPTYVLLITDGLMNCNEAHAFPCRCSLESGCPGGVPEGGEVLSGDERQCLDDDASIAEVQRLAGKGIKTFVVGLGNLGSDPVAVGVLNALADAGGAQSDPFFVRFHAATNGAELQQALDSLLAMVAAP